MFRGIKLLGKSLMLFTVTIGLLCVFSVFYYVNRQLCDRFFDDVDRIIDGFN